LIDKRKKALKKFGAFVFYTYICLMEIKDWKTELPTFGETQLTHGVTFKKTNEVFATIVFKQSPKMEFKKVIYFEEATQGNRTTVYVRERVPANYGTHFQDRLKSIMVNIPLEDILTLNWYKE